MNFILKNTFTSSDKGIIYLLIHNNYSCMIFLHGTMNQLMENYILYLVDASRSNVNKFDLHAFTHK